MTKILTSNLFLRFKKKSSKKLQLEIDKQVKIICNNPKIVELKKGDLKNIRVYKFTFGQQLLLLSYETKNKILFLYSIGSHENFYKKLKTYLR